MKRFKAIELGKDTKWLNFNWLLWEKVKAYHKKARYTSLKMVAGYGRLLVELQGIHVLLPDLIPSQNKLIK